MSYPQSIRGREAEENMSWRPFARGAAVVSVLALSSWAYGVTIPTNTSVGPASSVTTPGDGLAGKYWVSSTPGQWVGIEVGQPIPNADGTPSATIPTADQAVRTTMAGPPLGTFTARNIDYGNPGGSNDLTPIRDFLNTSGSNDGATYQGTDDNFDDGALQLKGFIRVPEAGTVGFHMSSDDGTRLWIGGVPVVNNDGSHGGNPTEARSRGDATFDAPGVYPIEIVWWNGNWTDPANPASHGGAETEFMVDAPGAGFSAGLVPSTTLYTTNPIPEPIAAGTGVLAAALLALRRWS
jgi:hypothetical protein